MFSIFKKTSKPLKSINFESLRTDMHSHLIAGIDDGSPDLETSISLIGQLKEMGFQRFITTPHIMADFYRNTPEIIGNGLEQLELAINSNDQSIELKAAAEYLVDFEFEAKIDNQEPLLTFGDKYILIETSFISAPPNFEDIIFKLQLKGYKVILAHPERFLFMTPKDYESYKNRSVFFQLNLLSLIGYYGKPVQHRAQQLIQKNMIDFVGTDCHNQIQANMYEKCFTNSYWHKLVESGFLKNHLL